MLAILSKKRINMYPNKLCTSFTTFHPHLLTNLSIEGDSAGTTLISYFLNFFLTGLVILIGLTDNDFQQQVSEQRPPHMNPK